MSSEDQGVKGEFISQKAEGSRAEDSARWVAQYRKRVITELVRDRFSR